MNTTYAVLGSGRQGAAAAYDMALWGNAARVILADQNLEISQRAAERVNGLIGRPVAEGMQIDVTDQAALQHLFEDVDVVLSAVPYFHNLEITRLAIAAGTHLCDLGGNTDIVRQQLSLDSAARLAGVSIIPDCGQVPGLGNTLMVYAMQLLDQATDVYMWDGGLPQEPKSPFDYMLTFHIAGLTNEYAEPGIFLRQGEIVSVAPLTELEEIDFPPAGKLEAFVTGGGTSTMPWTFKGKLRTLQNLTLRYPGHFHKLRAYLDLGLLDLQPVRVGEVQVVPRDVFHSLFEPRVTYPGEKDLVLIRIKALGSKDGHPAEGLVELVDHYDESTGFTAMERTTGWSAAIVAEMMARKDTPLGAGTVESYVSPSSFVAELHRRGFNLTAGITKREAQHSFD
jgi:lysine 6-dehydrogenase